MAGERVPRHSSPLPAFPVTTENLASPNKNTDHFSDGYSDVTGSRVLGTTYTAGTTARMVIVKVNFTSGNGGNWHVTGSIGDPLVEFYRMTSEKSVNGITEYGTVVLIVPPGVDYAVDAVVFAGVVATLDKWHEVNL